MMQFWMYAALLCALAVVVVCWPRRRRWVVDREGTNVALYRQRLDELARERDEGRLSDQELATLTDELAAGRALHPAKPVPRVLMASDAAAMIAAGRSTERLVTAPAHYKLGDTVRARNIHPAGHTRLPRYVRGRTGTITHLHGGHVFPDTNATGAGEAPQWLYTVRFTGTELWGADADPSVTVSVDAWESYLEAPR